MGNIREVYEGTKYQGVNEELNYTLTTTKWGTYASGVAVTATDEDTHTTVTDTLFPSNTPSVSGNVITLDPCKDMTLGHTYKVSVLFTDDGGNIWQAYFIIKCV